MAGTRLTIAVHGAAGRMGQQVTRLVREAGDLTLGPLLERSDHPESGATYQSDPREALARVDAVIDFSTPGAAEALYAAAANAGVAIVSGTTGLEGRSRAGLDAAAAKVAAVWAPNMSLAMNVLFAVTEKVAAALPAAYEIEIGEIHHRHKKDAPSGSALGLLRAARAGRGQEVDPATIYGRHGKTESRPEDQIAVHALRGGEVIGEHTVYFFGPEERLELTHRVRDRATFATGAVLAARWAVGQAPGLYHMKDVLGL